MRRLLLIVSVIVAALLSTFFYSGPMRQSDGWSQMASMQTGRSEISAATINDQIYVAGGIGFFRTLKSCEVYNIPRDNWSNCPDLPLPLHHVALAGDGKYVYAAGGYSKLNFGIHEDAKIWKLGPSSDQWSPIVNLPEGIGEHAMVSYEGALYIIGGRNSNGDSDALRRYDLVQDKRTELEPMPVPRHSFVAILVEEDLWIIGGRSEALGTRIDRIDIYSFVENSWRDGPKIPLGRGGHAASYIDGKVHIFGGEVFDPTKIIERHDIYDLETQIWTQGTLAPAPRHGSVAVSFEEDVFLIGGGSRPAFQTIFSASRTVQKLSISTK